MDITTLKARGLIRPVTAASAQPDAFPYGLGVHGVHEVTETAYGHRAAATGFVLGMLRPTQKGACLWICQTSVSRDAGRIPAASLQQMTGGQGPRLCINARKSAEALWSAEEGIMSGAVRHVVVELEEADFTATRRLALASEKHGVPVTLLLPHSRSGATAAATRWRVGTQLSAMNRHDPRAPGQPRYRALLERCRTAPAAVGQAFDLEWNDETLSLHMVSGMAAGPAAPRPAPSFATRHGHQRRAG
jgi:protein ImuA